MDTVFLLLLLHLPLLLTRLCGFIVASLALWRLLEVLMNGDQRLMGCITNTGAMSKKQSSIANRFMRHGVGGEPKTGDFTAKHQWVGWIGRWLVKCRRKVRITTAVNAGRGTYETGLFDNSFSTRSNRAAYNGLHQIAPRQQGYGYPGWIAGAG
jgi:hypothetical protein